MRQFAIISAPAPVLALVLALATGCGNGSSEEPIYIKPNPTYYEDIAPIVQAKCVQCHSEGNIAPFSLETYEEAQLSAGAMKIATESRRMPPWGPDSSGDCNQYRDDMSLSELQIGLIANWASTGAPMGDPANAPPPPAAAEELDSVSMSVGLSGEYTPNKELFDDYRCFVIDPGLSADKFLTAYAVRPGAPSEVHHVVVWALDSAADDDTAAKLDADEPGLGYTCFGGPGTTTARTLLGWAPGGGVTRYPEGSGLRMTAGRKLVMQVHYNLTAGAAPDQTAVDLLLEDSVAEEGLITGVGDYDINLVPGKSDAVELADTPFPAPLVPVKVHGAFPHMHKYGRKLRVDMIQGLYSSCLIDVPRYSFNWQRFYFYDKPIEIPTFPGAFRITCTYDTDGATSMVHFGEGTSDEMCLNGFYVTY